jgi:hypothetical protein
VRAGRYELDAGGYVAVQRTPVKTKYLRFMFLTRSPFFTIHPLSHVDKNQQFSQVTPPLAWLNLLRTISYLLRTISMHSSSLISHNCVVSTQTSLSDEAGESVQVSGRLRTKTQYCLHTHTQANKTRGKGGWSSGGEQVRVVLLPLCLSIRIRIRKL